MPALMLHLRSPSPGPIPASRQSYPAWEGNSERSRCSSPSACGGPFSRELQPRCHLLFLFHPWCSSIRTAKRRVADNRVSTLALDQPLPVFSNEQAAGVRLRAPLGNQPNMKVADQLVGDFLVVVHAMDLFDPKGRKTE